MDSETIADAGVDGAEGRARLKGFVPTTTTTTAYFVPSVRIRASPSFDDDSGDNEIEFDYGIDDVDEGVGGGGAVELNERKEFSGSSSFRILSSVGSSSEEEEEGGFLSGEEEFVAALNRPYVADEEEEEEEEVDVAFVEPFESLRPIAKLSEDDEDDADVGVSGSESDEEVALEHGIDNDVDEVSKISVPGEGMSQRTVGNADEVQSAVVKHVGEGLLEVDGVRFTTGGDSVIESINVDVNVAEPGVVVVEDVKPAFVASSGSTKPEDASIVTEVEEREMDEEFGDKKVEIVEKDKSVEIVKEDMSALVSPSNDDLTAADGVKLASEGDVVVEPIQVDLQEESGVIVVNGSEEIINLPGVEEKDDMLVRNLAEEESLCSGSLAHDEMLVISGEVDSEKIVNNVEQSKGSEIKGDEVHVNGRSIKEDEDKPFAAKLEDEVVIEDGMKFTTEGNSAVEVVRLNVSEPGVMVVEGSKEGEKPEVKVESVVGEAVELNNGLNQTSAAVSVEGGVSYSHDDDGIFETGINQVRRQDEVNEVDQYTRGYSSSDTVDLDQEESADDEMKHLLEESHDMEGSASDDETDGMIFGSSEAAKLFLEDLEQRSVGGSHSGDVSSRDRSQMIDGQIVTDSDEEVDADEEGSGKQLFDSTALAALLKAATGGASDGNVTLSAQDVSDLFSVKSPSGLVSSLRARPTPRQVQPNLFSSSSITAREESESNLSEEERKKLVSIQQLRIKFLRLVHRLRLSPEDSIAAQVLYRLVLVAGRPSSQVFSLEAAKRTAQELENQGEDNLNFSLNILVMGKSGVGKSATINSIFDENKTGTNAFEPATTFVKEITGVVDGVHIRVFDTPGLKTSIMDQGVNRKILASIKKATKKCPPDIVLYVDRLDSQTRDLNDLPLLRTITSSLGPSIWRSATVTLTHASSTPPDGPSGPPLSYEVFVAQRSHAIQQSIGQALGDLRLMNPSMMNPVSLAENHPSCHKNSDGQMILPNGQTWRPQLLMFCYSMKILSEASALYKQQDQFDHQKLFGFRMRAPPLPYLLSWLLQSRRHPKLSADQGGVDGDSDIDLNDLSESEGEEEENEYDQLPPFKPLRKSQLAKLNKEQLKAYHEEYDYRVKLLQKKQLKEELKRMKEMKKGKVPESAFFGGDEADPENEAPASVPVPLPDMVLPPSFDCDNPAYRYRFLEPSSQFLARPVLDNHGWDHDCGYDGVNIEQSLAISSRFPTAATVQLTKDKKEFNVHLDSSVAVKHGDNNASTMAGFDIQNIGKKLAYIVRGETKFKNIKKNKATAGFSVTFLGENVATGVKIEDQLAIGKRLVLTGSTGTVRSQSEAVYGANLEIKLRDSDFPIGRDQSSLGLSLVKWRGDLALGANLQSQFSVGGSSKAALCLGLNNKSSGQITLRTSTSDPLQIALVGILTVLLGIYRAILSGVGDN